MIQVYGQFRGFWSHAQVSRGITYGLHKNGMRELQVCNVDRHGGYEGLSEPIEQGGYNISLPSGISPAPIGLWVGGYPPQLGGWLEDHPIKVALFISESSTIPKNWADIANRCHIVIVPSEWTKGAYQRAGVAADRMMVVPHGIHPLYLFAEAQRPAETPRFLHVCGSASFPQRKGTPQLIAAWKRAFPNGEAQLYVRMMPGGHEVEDLCFAGTPGVHLEHSADALRPDQMISLQCGGGFCANIQPSRAEAFGIVPVEARAVGLPVILTGCAGHAEHAGPRDIIVRHRMDAAIRVNGIPNGSAPQVTIDDVVDALESWKKTRPGLQRNVEYARRWQWPELMRKISARLRDLLAGMTGPRTLNTF